MRAIFLILMSLSWAIPAAADDDPQSLYKAAAEAYQAKNYQAALDDYEKILALNVESADLYYNLGNTRFKLKDLPGAIWCYEKALKLRPGDEDIRFNLNLANTRIIDKIEAVPELFYMRWWKNLRALFAPDAWARTSVVFVGLFFLFTALYLLLKKMVIRKISFWLAVFLLLLSLASLVFSWQSYRLHLQRQEAIVFSPAVNVKSSPDENSMDLFVVHEGTKVVLSDQLGEWFKIQLANGSVGWVQAETVKEI